MAHHSKSLVVVFVVFGLAAPSASAATFNSETATTYWTGSQSVAHVLTTAAGTIKCKNISFTAESTASSFNELILVPTYSECTAFGMLATVSVNGCTFNFTMATPGEGPGLLSCPKEAGLLVQVPSGSCSVEIGPQKLTGAVTYKDQGYGNTRDTVATWGFSGLTYTTTGSETICGKAGSGGVYSGTVTEKGFSDAARTKPVGVWTKTAGMADFRYETGATYLKAEQSAENRFSFPEYPVKCKKGTAEGSVSGTSAAYLSLVPTYLECTIPPFATQVIVLTNGCAFTLDSGSGTAGSFEVTCPSGKVFELKIAAWSCQISIPAQIPGSGVDYANQGSAAGRSILMTWTVEGLSYTSSGGACGASGSKATLSGSANLRAFNGPSMTAQKGIWLE